MSRILCIKLRKAFHEFLTETFAIRNFASNKFSAFLIMDLDAKAASNFFDLGDQGFFRIFKNFSNDTEKITLLST